MEEHDKVTIHRIQKGRKQTPYSLTILDVMEGDYLVLLQKKC